MSLRSSRRIRLAAAVVLSLQGDFLAYAFESLRKEQIDARVDLRFLSRERPPEPPAEPAVKISFSGNPIRGLFFFGNDVVIPLTLTVTSSEPGKDVPLSTVEVIFQPLPSGGPNPRTLVVGQDSLMTQMPIRPDRPITRRPARLRRTGPHTFMAVVIIPRRLLAREGIAYYIRAAAPGGEAFLGSAENPFMIRFTRVLTAKVGSAGGRVAVPDTNTSNGETSVTFPPGSLSGPASVEIRQEETVPEGPKGAPLVTAYRIDLSDATLKAPVEVALVYPTEEDGTVDTFAASPAADASAGKAPEDLRLWWFDGHEWRILARNPQLDRDQSLVSAKTTRLALFALFPTGPVAASDLRPMERIMTPNGDGMNDVVNFGTLTESERIKIFDINGRRVTEIPGGPTPVWDGRDDEGFIVESGIYLYQYRSDGELVSGVILVAK